MRACHLRDDEDEVGDRVPIARSGPLLLTLKPHRTTRERSLESSAEPAFCAS
jgi:hypothetical protein